MLRIGPSGNSEAFYAAGFKHTYEAPAWLKSLGLTCYEYSFGRGVRMTDDTAAKLNSAFKAEGIEISVHAPYFTNFANPDPDMIEKSFGYVLQSLDMCHKLGGKRVVFHPASLGKDTRAAAFNRACENIKELAKRVSALDFDYILCPETMGKVNQMGTVEETLEFCKFSDKFYPCFDFGHINSYTKGSLKTKEDYKAIIDKSINEIGFEKTKNMHVHFSHIQYADKGEIRHLTFADTVYGPEYAPLAEVIDEYKLTPYIVCESSGTMSDDALTMKSLHKNV